MDCQHLDQFSTNPPSLQKNTPVYRKIFLIKFGPVVSDLLPKILPNIFGIIANWGRWSKMVAVKLPDIMSGSRTRVLEWLIILVDCKIKGINDLEARESQNSFAWLCSL